MTYKELKEERIKSGEALKLEEPSNSSVAGRVEMVMSLYQSVICNEDGEIIGYEPSGIITKEQALELLGFSLKTNK